MRAYFDVLTSAFSESKELNEIIDNLSGGNVRVAFEFLTTLVGSAYVSAERLTGVAERGAQYYLPVHEFLRAIIFGDAQYFSPRSSRICNVFDITSDDGREHFLMCILLAHVERSGEVAGSGRYIDLANVYSFAQGVGFSQEQVGPQLVRALERNLVDAPQGGGVGGPFRITTVGSYMYKSMVSRFSCVDAMMVDTPIVDIESRRKIGNVLPILERLDRAEAFRDYLDRQWAKVGGASQLPFQWEVASTALHEEIDQARLKAQWAIARRN